MAGCELLCDDEAVPEGCWLSGGACCALADRSKVAASGNVHRIETFIDQILQNIWHSMPALDVGSEPALKRFTSEMQPADACGYHPMHYKLGAKPKGSLCWPKPFIFIASLES